MPNQIMDLTRMNPGEKGAVLEIRGGFDLIRRLETLGIRQGVEMTKVSAQIARGPVTVRVGNTQVAIGFGMAKEIVVEIKE